MAALSAAAASTEGGSPGGPLEPLDVADRRRPELPLVVAAEVRRVVVPDPVPRRRRVDVPGDQEPPGLLEPDLLLELERRHPGDVLEPLVERRRAHPEVRGQVLHPDRLVEPAVEPADRLGHPVTLASEHGDVAEPLALVAHEEPVDDLADRERGEDGRLTRGLGRPDEPERGGQKVSVERAHVERPPLRSAGRAAGLDQDLAHERRVEVEPEAEVRLARGRLDDVARDGEVGRDEEVVERVVAVPALTELERLGALGDHAEARPEDGVERDAGRRRPDEDEARERLRPAVVGDGRRDPLRQLGAVGSGAGAIAVGRVERTVGRSRNGQGREGPRGPMIRVERTGLPPAGGSYNHLGRSSYGTRACVP